MKMTKQSTYEPPAAGSHTAALIRITDLGEQPTKNYGPKPQLRMRFEVAEKDSSGRKKFVCQTFTNSLHEKSGFTKFFVAIGKPLPDGDGDLDTDTLLGVKFKLTLSHVQVDGKMKVRIVSVAPLGGAK